MSGLAVLAAGILLDKLFFMSFVDLATNPLGDKLEAFLGASTMGGRVEGKGLEGRDTL